MAHSAPGAGTLNRSRQWTPYPLVGVQGVIDRWRADYCGNVVERNRVNETWRRELWGEVMEVKGHGTDDT